MPHFSLTPSTILFIFPHPLPPTFYSRLTFHPDLSFLSLTFLLSSLVTPPPHPTPLNHSPSFSFFLTTFHLLVILTAHSVSLLTLFIVLPLITPCLSPLSLILSPLHSLTRPSHSLSHFLSLRSSSHPSPSLSHNPLTAPLSS